MSEFDEYIKSILAYSELSNIEQDELFLEIYDHLNSLKEEYMEQGMNEKEAVYKAIQSFGESKVIGLGINQSVYEVPRPLKVFSKILCIPYIMICFIVFLGTVISTSTFDSIRSLTGGTVYHPIEFWQQFLHISDLETLLQLFGITLWQVKDFIAHPGLWGNATYWLTVLQHIILIVPFGFFVPVWINKVTNYKKACKWYAMTFLAWEILHLLTLSDVFDVWRIAINMLGASVGYLLFVSMIQIDNKIKMMRKKIFEN
ncbi:VanZ family protein [Bacillus wiedmannii]|uniref:VanZ family protein n=1 Tax=Bacillus wiedmannii TaxID=1890302 RepID=UPI000BF0F7BC|nr:VanZ family protein [Bacillus wiedmannii]PEM24163.1 VanZ family protein [Bacillus wiedmannii]PEM93514.1 VanZ family protein [Bacillus wiedmannii]PEO85665.1 VanZ family protein [Bacillus wiedmannii]